MNTVNEDHMTYVSWDMENDRQNFLSFYPIINLMNQFWKKFKKKKKKKMPGEIIILHVWNKNYDHMMYESWDKVHEEWMDWQTDEWKHTSRFFW